jgi:catechol 2,3-dioxygenase-like lactoylglutathione lyase family enzyme
MPRQFSRIAPQFEVEDVARAVKWYVEALDFRVERSDSECAWLSLDGEFLVLIAQDGAEPARAVIGRDPQRDVDALYDRYADRDLMFLDDLGAVRGGGRGFTVADPDGNLLTFVQDSLAQFRVVTAAE